MRVAAGVAILLVLSVLLSVAGPAHAQQPDTTPPTLVSAETSTDGERITLTFSEDVTAHPIVYVAGDLFNARPGDFLRSIMNLTIDGQRELLFSADISGATITYRVITPAIRRPQVVKLAYNNIFARSLEGTSGGLIIDKAGNALPFFDEMNVVNNSTIQGSATTRQGPTLSTDALTIDEGGTATYTVRLPSQPTGPVELVLNTIPDAISVQPQTLTFTVDDWDTPQTVTLTARSDTHSFVVWALVGHTYSDLLPHIDRSSSFLRVVVENQDTPLVVSGGSTEPILYAENGTTDLATYSVTATTVTWAASGEDEDAFAIGSTGVLSFVSPPDFEDPSDADGDNVYTVGIVAADGSATGLAFATVVVANVELPEFPSATTTRSVAENTAAGADIGAPLTAATVGAAVTYTLGGTDAASFDIVEETGQLQTKAALDYETRSSYEVTVTATNSEGSVDIIVTIDVTNIIELQPLTGPATVGYEENRAVRVAAYSASSEEDRELLTWSLSGANAGGYDSTRTLSTGLEPGTGYDVRIRSLNGGKPSANSTKVTARAGADNNPATGLPTLSGDTAPGSELSASVEEIGDADGLSGAQFTYQWLRVSVDSETEISGANSAIYVVSLDDLGFMLKVQVNFTDDLGNPETLTSMVSVTVTFPAGECDAIDLGDRRSVWSGVMSPIALATTPLATGYNAKIGGTLSDTQLMFDNETRTIERFEVLNVSADLILAFDQALTDRGNETQRLHLCGEALAISDATTNIDGVISWGRAGPDWSSATKVQAELTIPGNYPPRFASDSVERDLAENSPDGAAVGDPVTADDWDDDTLSYTLSGTYAAAFGIDAATGQITTAPNTKFNFENTTALDVTVTATDPGGDSDTVDVIITITDVPEPATGLPTVEGIAQENRALYADAYTIEDPDGIPPNSFSYQWVRVEGNTDILIPGETSAKYVVAAADVGFTLKVIISFTDSGGTVERLTSAESDTVVAAMPSECPAPDLGGRIEVWSATLTPANIDTALGTIGYDAQHGTLSDTSFDVAGDETVIEQIYVNEYTDRLILAFDSDQALPEQGHRTLRLHLCGKSVPLAGGGLAIHHILRWSSLRLDWTAGTTVHLALSAPAANVELPEFPSATTTRSVAENTAAVMDIGAPVTATTVGAAVTYTLGGTDAASFDIVEATGQLQTKAALDYETRSSYEVTVTATNSEGSVDIMVTIDVTNIIELQPLTGPATVDYEENRAVRVATFSASSEEDRELLTWSLSGPDAGSFRIDEPAGVLRFDLPIVSPNLFSPQPDYEAPTDAGTDGAYEVTVEVGDGVSSDSLDVEVTITDQDEAGTLTLSPTRPRQAELVTATLSDPDTVTGTPVWTWERSAGRSAWHVINGATAASYTPTAADAGHYLRVTASYTDGHGSGQTARAVTPNVVLARTLSRLEVVTTSSRQMYPAFEPEILHYAVGCIAADTLRLTLSTTDAATRLAVDGVQYANQNAVVELTGKGGKSDILITLSDASDGASTTYTIHCLAEDFPTFTVTKGDGASESLMTASFEVSSGVAHIAIIDHNGVPRFRRQQTAARHFRAYPDGGYPYALAVTREPASYVVYDANLDVVQSGISTVNLQNTDGHDFFIKPNGDYVLMAYEPSVRDLSFITEQYGLTDSNGDPFGVAEDTEDSVIQVITPDSQELFLWNSWDHMALEDCTQHRFPDDYSHINSLQVVDGDIVASFRGCSKVLRIDGTSGEVIWRLGRSNLSTEEWERRNIGPPPLKIVGDPYGEFCGQHAARLLDNGHLILFDNGVQCVEDPRTGETERVGDQFSRVVEYAIDLEQGEAIFQRHVFLHGSMNRLSYAMGQADALDNGNWLITWGRGARAPNPGDPPAPDVSATQVNPATGVEELTVVARIDGDVQTQGRMYPVAPVALAAEPIALTAEFPASTYTSIFHIGATDEPQVVVSFSRPIVDFDETSPSLSVSGAEVASVSAHVVAGEPAHAYLVTLTPDGYGPITFRLLSYQACADGGICTADGTMLTEVPAAPVIIPTFVAEVSIEPGPSPVTEGADVTFTLTRDGPLTAELTVNVSVAETGSMLSGALPASATFEVGADTTSLTLTTEDDAPIEDPSTVTVTIEAGARYQAAPGAATADAVVLDDLPRFLLKVGPAEVTEGGGGAVTVEIDNGVSLATAQTISLTLSGTATADDFTLLNTSDRTLSAPYALTIPANERVAAAYISTVNDALAEPAETLTITASHDGTDIGTETMTLRASPLRLELSSLTASGGGGRAMYPAFDPGTLHYAVGCDPTQTLTLRLSTRDATTRLAVNGVQQVSQNAVVALNQLDGDDDIQITLSNAGGASTTYVVHCMNSDDPYLKAEKRPGSSTELISISTNLSGIGHLFVVDPNGVPRVHLRVVTRRVNHFRPQDHPDFAYSYAQILPEPFQSPWGLRRDFEIVILDRDFNEVRRVTTTDAIQHTDQHDFLVKPNGNFVLMAYEPIEHDLSEFVDHHGNPYSTTEPAEDSVIEEVTPDGEQVFFWNSYNHMYLGDCMLSQFPANYGHLNSLQLVDGEDLVISLRNCSQILRIDGTSGEVQWRLGSSYRSDVEWEALGLQPPLQIIGDPYVEFCAQHSAKLMPNGHLLLYDNGWHCPRDPATGLPRRPEEEFSRVVEYALDLERGTATFVRHHSLHHSFSFFNPFQGIVAPLENDSWLVSWGSAVFNSDSPPDTTATEYNFKTDQELLSLWLKGGPAESLRESRAYPLGFDALEQQAEPLAAALPQSAHTSVFTFGQTDTPTVVVAFGQPVKDFAADTPSVSVGGATIASVAAHVMPGEPANAYLFTLTPDGDGPITLGLFANQSCASGGICTADGARLSEVPDAYTIEAPVRVSFTQESFTASEGASASVMVSLSAPSGPFGITIPIVVTGGTASADEYSAPESVVFSSGSDRQTVSIPLGDDALIEGDETISLAFGDLPTGVTPGTNSTTTVTITDADSAAFEFAISDDEVGEGAAVELTVTLIGGATFAAAQTIDLTFSGGAATAGVDFTVADSRGQTLTAPYALTLPAGSSSVAATISIVDDAEEEGNETIVVSARHGADALGDLQVITILANDAPPPPTNSPPVFTEGRNAARSLAENTGPSINIGRRFAATDVDQGDTLTYSLGGTDAGSFDISLTSGQLRTKSGIVYDHEARAHYEVTVSVSDGAATASIDVTIEVTDVDEPPDAPVVQVDTASPVSLEVTWLAPATSGRPAVSNYDLRYKLDSETGFIDGPQDVSGTSTTIGELIPASSYDVQVRATNAEGDGPWSASQPGETAVLPAVTLILSASSIPEDRGMSTVTATVSPASPTAFSLTVWAVAFPPFPGQFETSANSVLSFAANETQSTGEVVITGLVAVVVNVTGTVSPPGVLVKPPARVQLRITAVEPETDVDPEVAVRFGSAAYNVPEGGIRRISVVLDEDPERTVVIPITKTNQGGARSDDYSVNPDPTNVTFNAGGDLTQTFTFTATLDTVDDDGESVLLGFDTPNLPTRVSVGTTSQSTVRITDDDDPEVTVKFGASSINVGEGDSATITVTISADPERELQIPIMATGKNGADPTDFSRTPAVLIFPSGSTADRTFTVTAFDDTQDDDGETVELSFGTMPDDRVSPDPDSHTSVTVTLVDNDDPLVTVSFQSDKYTVPESDDPATTSDTENEVTVSVVLDKDPKRTVVIPITKTNQGGARRVDYSVDPDPTNVTFNAGGNLTQTFTFTATADTDDDDGESVLLGFGTMPDARVTVGTTSQSTVSITDDDHPEVTVKFGASSINVGEGDSATITVTISADPERTVVIRITKTEENGATAQGETGADYSGVPNSVIFTASGSQTFTLTATQDRIDDDNERVELGFDTPNLPTRVTAANPTTQTINIGDDDERGVAVSPVTLSVNEGMDGKYTVVLTSEPTEPVTVTPSTVSPEVTILGLTSSDTLNFTTSNWATKQTVTVRAPEDGDAVSETLTVTHTTRGGGYDMLATASVAVTLVDDDVPGVAISTSALTIRENATDTFNVKLNTQPDNNVTVTITSGDPAVATVRDDSLTFTTGDWSTEQEVTVRGVEDDGAANNNTTITFGVSGYGSVTTAAPVTVTVEDDDERAVTISASTLTVEEEAAATDPPTNTYTVVLATQPEGNVTVAITSDNDDIRTNGGSATAASPYNLTFTSTNWDQPQTVAVTVINDLDGWNEEATLTHAVSGADYEAVNAAAVVVTVADNDPLGLRVSPAEHTTEPVDVTEGTTYSYTLALLTVPLGDVTVEITSDNPDVTVDPTKLTILAAQWSAPHTVKITAAADANGEDEPATLAHTVSGYGTYTTGPDFLVQVLDRNEPGVFIEPATLAITEGFEDAYSVSLRTEPSGAVTVQVAGHAGTDLKVRPESLTFSSSDWNVPQAVTVTAAEDEDADNDTVTLTHTVSGYGTVTSADDVTVTIMEPDSPVTPVTPQGLGGGGGPSGPTPSGIEFEWNVTRDIEQLDSGHDAPTGAWSDGTLLWLAENGDGADDAVYAYDLVTGERVAEREFELDESNRAPRGLWSNGKTAWVADSGQDRLFAYDLESGERDEEREVELDTRNRDPRGIWSDGTTVWVLDGGKNALFGYDLASGELIAEYALDDANGDPRGIWSDGVTVWVSDHGAKRLFAYRLAAQDAETTTGEDEEAAPLERARDEEFTELSRASNNSPRGIWSDGEVMYVADESDGRVYSYNLPDAIDARLASLTLSGVEFGEFLSRRTEYEGVADEGVTETTVEAEAAQRGATVAIAPADAGEATDGHQLALDGLEEITVTVTSADESRTKVYLVRFGGASGEPSAAACLRGAITVGFSLLVYGGGSVEELLACAESRDIVAIYALHEGEYVSYILGAPAFVNSAFREVYSGGVPALTPLTARSEGPATADPAVGSEVTEPWPQCLRGAITEGFSLVLYEGGSVDALDACAQSREVSAVYALVDGEYVSYILGAPDFVNAAFRELFADGLPAVTPLVVKGEGPPRAN